MLNLAQEFIVRGALNNQVRKFLQNRLVSPTCAPMRANFMISTPDTVLIVAAASLSSPETQVLFRACDKAASSLIMSFFHLRANCSIASPAPRRRKTLRLFHHGI